MLILEGLEKGCINTYPKAFSEIKSRNEKLYFYTPRNKITVTGKWKRSLNMEKQKRHLAAQKPSSKRPSQHSHFHVWIPSGGVIQHIYG